MDINELIEDEIVRLLNHVDCVRAMLKARVTSPNVKRDVHISIAEAKMQLVLAENQICEDV